MSLWCIPSVCVCTSVPLFSFVSFDAKWPKIQFASEQAWDGQFNWNGFCCGATFFPCLRHNNSFCSTREAYVHPIHLFPTQAPGCLLISIFLLSWVILFIVWICARWLRELSADEEYSYLYAPMRIRPKNKPRDCSVFLFFSLYFCFWCSLIHAQRASIAQFLFQWCVKQFTNKRNMERPWSVEGFIWWQ